MGSILYKKYEDFGVRLKRLRKAVYKTQDDFAEAMGVTTESVRNWEQGRVLPEMGTLFKICEILDCDLDYLTGRIDCMTHNLQFIHDQTGLSEEAIRRLQSRKETNVPVILSSVVTHRLFDTLIKMISRLSDSDFFNTMFAESVINRIKNDGIIYTDSPDDFRAIYENHTTTIFHDIISDIIEQ